MRDVIAGALFVSGLLLAACTDGLPQLDEPGSGDDVASQDGSGTSDLVFVQGCPLICSIVCQLPLPHLDPICSSAFCSGCGFDTDDCGNGVVDANETCDIAIEAGQPGACPSTCDDGDVCTRDMLDGAGTCQAACASAPVAECTNGDGCCPDGCDGSDDSDCGGPVLDISGTWISHATTTGTITVPLINNQPATIDIVLRIVVVQSGGNLASHLELCRLNTATNGNSLVVNFPNTVLSLLNDDQTIPLPPLSVGGPVPLPPFTLVAGQDAAGNPVDDDVDGNPGVTLPTVLLGSTLTAFSGLEVDLSFLSTTLTDPNTIVGDSTFSTTGTVFDTVPLGLSGPIVVTPSSPTTAFGATRLVGDVPCSQVLTMFP